MINILITILFIIDLILSTYYIISNNKYKKNKQKISELRKEYNELEQKIRDNKTELIRLEKDKDNTEKEIEHLITTKNQQIIHNDEIISQMTKQRQMAEEANNELLSNQQELLDNQLYNYYETILSKYNEDTIDIQVELLADARNEFNEQIDIYNKQLQQIKQEVDEFYRKRDAINQEILRQRAIEEKQDFYKIALSDEDKRDISFLLSITKDLRNPQILYKLIWTEYLQKPFNQMLKNVLGNKEPKNVIYIITNIKTNEIYIGKTKSEVSKRWTEHIKTSLNIGGVTPSLIHKKLLGHWDEFTFNVLERVPDDGNLGEREKYYINFYQSDKFGYNIKNGG